MNTLSKTVKISRSKVFQSLNSEKVLIRENYPYNLIYDQVKSFIIFLIKKYNNFFSET